MKTFDEQFPSLKGKCVDSFENGIEGTIVDTIENYYSEQDIQNYCLDKKEVTTVLIRICEKYKLDIHILEDFLTELGL